jgi:hypothetical protein
MNKPTVFDEPAITRREHFIPIRKADLVRLLANDSSLPQSDREDFRQLCRLLEATFHFEYQQRLEELKDAYAAFDPDSDTQQLAAVSPDQRDRQANAFFDQFVDLIERANYRRLSHADLLQALEARSSWGVNLDVDFDVFDRLEVFVRGDRSTKRTHRSLRTMYRTKELEVRIFQRLVVIFRPRNHKRFDDHLDADTVYLKTFKDIPQDDLEMLLPGTRVKMTLLDQGKILMPAVSGIGITIYKIAKGAVVLAFAGVYGLLAWLGLVGGTLGYGVKSFFGYLRAKDKYQLNLTRSLYFQSLDNNAGVLFRLLDEVEEQEFREAILAYFLLSRVTDTNGWSEQRLDEEAESLLLNTLGRDVDFEVDDALEKLVRLNLVEELPSGNFRAVPLAESLRRLDHAWDNNFLHNNPAREAA